MTLRPRHAPRATRARAVALVIAVSVLAILTILVMGLATAQRVTVGRAAGSHARQTALELIRLGRQSIQAQLAQGAPVAEQVRFQAPEGDLVLSASEAAPDAPLYASSFLEHRPGDYLVTIRATVLLANHRLQLEHLYLLNASPSHERTLRLRQMIDTLERPRPASQTAPADEERRQEPMAPSGTSRSNGKDVSP